jgi:ATP-dependent RNA helicase DeaD
MLAAIEKATRKKIDPLELPSTETVNNQRIARFKQSISDTLAAGELSFMESLIEQYQQEHDVPALEIAAALAKMSLGDQPLLLVPERPPRREARHAAAAEGPRPSKGRKRREHSEERRQPQKNKAADSERFRVEVGHQQGVQPANLVGAIANEAGLDAQHIGHIDIRDEFSVVELPTGMPRDVFRDLKKVWVCGKQLAISRLDKDGKPVRKARKRVAESGTPSKPIRKKRHRSGDAPEKRKARKR